MASITVRSLLTKWGFEANTKPIEKLNKSLADTKTAVTLIGAAVISQVGVLFGLTNVVSAAGDEFAKMASRIGIDVEALQEYAFVSKLAGSSTQEMTSAVESLTLGIAEARKGSGKLIEPLIRLNQLTGKDLLTSMGNADEMFLQLADSLGQVEDATERAELSQKIFGGTGLAMVNILKQGSAEIRKQRQEARDLGIVFSEDAAKRSEVFQDSLLRVKSAVTGIRNVVGLELMPVVQSYMDLFRAWILQNKEWLKTNIVKTLDSMVKGTKIVFRTVKAMTKVFVSAIDALGGFQQVLKNVIFFMSLFAAVKFLSAIGNLALAVGGTLVFAFRALGNAALLAQAKMVIVPIAIGLAIAGVLLLLDDLRAFFQGRDSITGEIVKSFEGVDIKALIKQKLDEAIVVVVKFAKEVKEKIKGIFDIPSPAEAIRKATKGALKSTQEFFDELSFDNFGEKISQLLLDALTADNILTSILGLFVAVFQGIGDALLATIGGVVDIALQAIGGIVDGIADFAGKDSIVGKFIDFNKKSFEFAKGLLGGGDEDDEDGEQRQPFDVKKLLAERREQMKNLQGNLGSLGITTSSQPAASINKPDLRLIQGGVGSSSSKTTTITNHNDITIPITIPAGTSPEAASEMVAEGVRRAMDQAAREAQAATATNVEQ